MPQGKARGPSRTHLHGPGGRVAERADGVPLDGPGDLLEHGDLARVGLPLLHLD